MQRKESSIEVKVGALVLISIVLFGGFVFLLGDFRFGDSFYFYLDFENAGGLKPGADVRVAGIPAGQVEAIQFLGGDWQDDVQRHVYVRVRVELDREMHHAVGEGAQYIITTLSVLGEPYIEIVNTVPPGEPIQENSIHLGQSPVRVDEMIRSAYRSLRGLDGLIQTIDRFFAESDLERLLTEASDLAEHLDQIVEENATELGSSVEHLEVILREGRERIVNLIATAEEAIIQFETLGASLNTAVGDGSVIRSALDSADELLEDLADRAPSILSDTANAVQTLDRILTEREGQVEEIVTHLDEITVSALDSVSEINDLVDYVSQGRGTIGALLRDDELYDDIRELVRELKRRPWRLIWKE